MFKVTEPQPSSWRPVVPELPKRRVSLGAGILEKIAILAGLVVMLVIGLWVAKTHGQFSPKHTTTYVVQQGDTEYGIIVRFDPDINIRAAEDWVSKENGLKDAQIYPGEVLTVPVKQKQ